MVAKEKSVRDSYRRFMGRQPHAWDYVVAQVPSPLTEDMERQRREKVRNNIVVLGIFERSHVIYCIICRLP